MVKAISSMKLNCDLGESFGIWSLSDDSQIMPYIDMANIACGFHAGDPSVIKHTLASAKEHGVSIGAHPSYPDLQGFGRRSMRFKADELVALMHYQIAALDGMAQCQQSTLSYVKPHGALYNDMMSNDDVLQSVLRAMSNYHVSLPLVIQATGNWQYYQDVASQYAVPLLFEAFADRSYQYNGLLTPRSQPGAVLAYDEIIKQVEQLLVDGSIITNSGKKLSLKVDTICVHGDTAEAIQAVKAIRTLIDG